MAITGPDSEVLETYKVRGFCGFRDEFAAPGLSSPLSWQFSVEFLPNGVRLGGTPCNTKAEAKKAVSLPLSGGIHDRRAAARRSNPVVAGLRFSGALD
jgi:hypothetical protein